MVWNIFFHVCPFDREGGGDLSDLGNAHIEPCRTNTFQKGASLPFDPESPHFRPHFMMPPGNETHEAPSNGAAAYEKLQMRGHTSQVRTDIQKIQTDL